MTRQFKDTTIADVFRWAANDNAETETAQQGQCLYCGAVALPHLCPTSVKGPGCV